MLEYLHANNFTATFNALQADARTTYAPDPKAKYAGLLEKKWMSVIRLQKKACAVVLPMRCPGTQYFHVRSWI
jgi:platelet-activating factor acetylhydrolase IB subunit alpha